MIITIYGHITLDSTPSGWKTSDPRRLPCWTPRGPPVARSRVWVLDRTGAFRSKRGSPGGRSAAPRREVEAHPLRIERAEHPGGKVAATARLQNARHGAGVNGRYPRRRRVQAYFTNTTARSETRKGPVEEGPQ